MEQVVQPARTVRFGIYEADLEAGELRKNGCKVSLQEQPFRVLSLLLLHPKRLVTREELQRRLWPADTFVDFDLGLNTAIKKIRAALGDSADTPRFIETLPRKGYRFIYPVEIIPAVVSEAPLPAESMGGSVADRDRAIPARSSSNENGNGIRQTSGVTQSDPQFSGDRSWRARSKRYRLGLVFGTLAVVLLAVGFSLYRLREKGRAGATKNFTLEKLQEQGTRVVAAHEAYLKGSDFLQADDLPAKDEKAVQAFEEAIRDDPAYALAYAGLGQAYWMRFQATGKDEWQSRAQDACNKSLELDAARAAGHVCAGVLHHGMGLYTRAAEDFSDAIAIEPGNARAYQGRAGAHERLGNMRAAEDDYLRSVNFDPRNWSAYTALAHFYFDQGNYPEAARNYDRAIAMKPDNSLPRIFLGAVYIEMGQNDKAVTVLQEAIRLKPGFGAYENLGTALLNARRFEESIQSFQKALELDGSDYRGYGNLARAYFWAPGGRKSSRERYGQAIALARQKLAVNPEDPDVNLNVAVYHAMLGQEDDALYHLDRSLRLQPTTGETAFWAGIVYLQLGHREKALTWLRQANELKFSAEMNVAPELDGVRNDLQFRNVVSQDHPR